MGTIETKHPLKNCKSGVINYKGTLVEVFIGGYEIFGKRVLTPEDVDKIIELGCESIEKSIKK